MKNFSEKSTEITKMYHRDWIIYIKGGKTDCPKSSTQLDNLEKSFFFSPFNVVLKNPSVNGYIQSL